MTKLKDTQSALSKFEEAAIKHAEATEHGDYKTANKSYATIVKVISFLKERDEILTLSGFLNHNSVGPRLWAAGYLLPVMENEGISVLEQITRESGIHSLTAKTALSEWRKGNLKL